MSTINDCDPFEDLLPRLRARARRLCGSRDEAEDIAQETALRLWQTLADRGEIKNPDRYAMIMLHNLVRQRWRQKRPTEELSEDTAQTPPVAAARLACAELQAAIGRLPSEQANVMEQLMAGESSPRVIAAETGVPLGTVMSRLARARARLRVDMQLDGSVLDLM